MDKVFEKPDGAERAEDEPLLQRWRVWWGISLLQWRDALSQSRLWPLRHLRAGQSWCRTLRIGGLAMIQRLIDDIEHIANGQWYLALAKGERIGNHKEGFEPVSIMDEHRFKDFVKEMLTMGINAGIEEAMKNKQVVKMMTQKELEQYYDQWDYPYKPKKEKFLSIAEMLDNPNIDILKEIDKVRAHAYYCHGGDGCFQSLACLLYYAMIHHISTPYDHVLLSNRDFEHKLNCLHDDQASIRKYFTEILQEEYPAFTYKGHGANIGLWETEDFQDLRKPRGEGYWTAKIRILLFLPTQYGFDTKVEMMLNSVYEWETAYEGYIHSVRDILQILDFQLGIKKEK